MKPVRFFSARRCVRFLMYGLDGPSRRQSVIVPLVRSVVFGFASLCCLGLVFTGLALTFFAVPSLWLSALAFWVVLAIAGLLAVTLFAHPTEVWSRTSVARKFQ